MSSLANSGLQPRTCSFWTPEATWQSGQGMCALGEHGGKCDGCIRTRNGAGQKCDKAAPRTLGYRSEFVYTRGVETFQLNGVCCKSLLFKCQQKVKRYSVQKQAPGLHFQMTWVIRSLTKSIWVRKSCWEDKMWPCYYLPPTYSKFLKIYQYGKSRKNNVFYLTEKNVWLSTLHAQLPLSDWRSRLYSERKGERCGLTI